MKYKIHPSIGIARVGSSNEFFIGPEVPDAPAAPPDGSYRDVGEKLLRRQAARFWIFAYDEANPDNAPRAIVAGKDGIARIEWTVHLANKKAVWYEFDGLTGEGDTLLGIRCAINTSVTLMTAVGASSLIPGALAHRSQPNGRDTKRER